MPDPFVNSPQPELEMSLDIIIRFTDDEIRDAYLAAMHGLAGSERLSAAPTGSAIIGIRIPARSLYEIDDLIAGVGEIGYVTRRDAKNVG